MTGLERQNNCHGWQGVGQRLHVGRSRVFQLWGSGELASLLIGGHRVSTDRQIDDYLARLEQAASNPLDAA